MKFRLTIAAALSAFLVGCASVPMGVNSSTKGLELNDKSLLILMVDISRQEASRFVPVPQSLFFGSVDDSGAKKDAKVLALDGDGWISLNGEKTLYAYRLLVPEGTTVISGISGLAKAFPLIGKFYVPLDMRLPVTKSKVFYLGRVEAVLRPRADNEYRAGDVIPLIDQSATGMSTGTFDVRVTDQSSVDLPLIRSTFPALASVAIESRLVPVVDREYVDMKWRGEDVTGVDPYKKSRRVTPTPSATGKPARSQIQGVVAK
jgi:hypothetical protein